MSIFIFAYNITAVLEDGTEVTDVTGSIQNNKRFYKLSDNTVLTGAKKIKEIKSIVYTIPAHFLPIIMSKENV